MLTNRVVSGSDEVHNLFEILFQSDWHLILLCEENQMMYSSVITTARDVMS